MAADTGTTYLPPTLGDHELVLLHGQPGSAADWQQVAGRLPAQFHAVAADRPGYGSSQLPAGGFAANARAVLDDLDARGIERARCSSDTPTVAGWHCRRRAWRRDRVEAVILLASVGPGCVNVWDRLLAAPGAGPLCALACLAADAMDRPRPARPDRQAARPARCARTSTSTGRSGVMRAAGTARCGAHSWPSSAPCSASSASWSTPSASVQAPVLAACRPARHAWFPSIPPAGSPAHCRTPACSSSRARVITCPGALRAPSPTR